MKKKINFFYNSYGIHTMIIYFALYLLISGYKNIYPHNDYLLEPLLLKVIFSKEGGLFVCFGYECRSRVFLT